MDAWKAFAYHDADRISEVFTEDAEWLAPLGNATAVALEGSGHLIGRKAIVRFLAEDFPRFFVRDVTVTFHGIYADGDRVIVEETMTATLANGNHYANDYCFVFELRNGLIHRVREYMDTARGHRMVFGEEKGRTRERSAVGRGGSTAERLVQTRPRGSETGTRRGRDRTAARPSPVHLLRQPRCSVRGEGRFEAGDVLGVLGAARAARYPDRHHPLDLDLRAGRDDRTEEVPDAAGVGFQQVLWPRRSRPRAAADHHPARRVTAEQVEAQVLPVLDQVDLLLRRQARHWPVAPPGQLRSQALRVIDPGEPVDVTVIPCHRAEEEVHRPAAPEPHRGPASRTRRQHLGDQPKLPSGARGVHGRER